MRRLAIVALVVSGACVNRLPDQDLRIIEAVPLERLSASLLWQEFQSNPAAAERKFRGKAVVVTGNVTKSGGGGAGDRYVDFAQTETAGVRAELLDEQADVILAAAKEAPRITLKCFCEGMTSNLVLKSCIAAP